VIEQRAGVEITGTMVSTPARRWRSSLLDQRVAEVRATGPDRLGDLGL
jgi:hypothetical protein